MVIVAEAGGVHDACDNHGDACEHLECQELLVAEFVLGIGCEERGGFENADGKHELGNGLSDRENAGFSASADARDDYKQQKLSIPLLQMYTLFCLR